MFWGFPGTIQGVMRDFKSSVGLHSCGAYGLAGSGVDSFRHCKVVGVALAG